MVFFTFFLEFRGVLGVFLVQKKIIVLNFLELANLQFFGPRYVMHVGSLCLPFSTPAQGSFSTLRDVFKFETFCKVLLMTLETLSPVPGHTSVRTVDSLGGTSATFMVKA